jgi:hypothetical protein
VPDTVTHRIDLVQSQVGRQRGDNVSDSYRARVAEIHDQGILLQPDPGTSVPDDPSEVNLLVLAIAAALGAADYEHHPEVRSSELQSLEALLAGETAIPWRPRSARADGADEPYLVCERLPSSAWTCRISR